MAAVSGDSAFHGGFNANCSISLETGVRIESVDDAPAGITRLFVEDAHFRWRLRKPCAICRLEEVGWAGAVINIATWTEVESEQPRYSTTSVPGDGFACTRSND